LIVASRGVWDRPEVPAQVTARLATKVECVLPSNYSLLSPRKEKTAPVIG